MTTRPSGGQDDDSRTRLSFIARLKGGEENAWAHFETFYGPIILRFARARGLAHDEAEEIRSACYEVVVKQIEELDYDQQRGKFRNWLLTIAARRVSDLKKRRVGLQADTSVLNAIEAPETDLGMLWEQQWRQQILLEAYRRVELRMNETSQTIFRRLVRESQSVAKIAEELSISENQIYKTKQRSLEMLREEISFLESDPLTAG